MALERNPIPPGPAASPPEHQAPQLWGSSPAQPCSRWARLSPGTRGAGWLLGQQSLPKQPFSILAHKRQDAAPCVASETADTGSFRLVGTSWEHQVSFTLFTSLWKYNRPTRTGPVDQPHKIISYKLGGLCIFKRYPFASAETATEIHHSLLKHISTHYLHFNTCKPTDELKIAYSCVQTFIRR